MDEQCRASGGTRQVTGEMARPAGEKGEKEMHEAAENEVDERKRDERAVED